MIIGFLAPDGKFTGCQSWEHMYKAPIICEKVFQKKMDSGYQAEQYLLKQGYVIFRARDAYMNHYKNHGKDDFRCQYLTDKQLEFINLHNAQADWNNSDQAESINDMVSFDADLRHYKKTKKEEE